MHCNEVIWLLVVLKALDFTHASSTPLKITARNDLPARYKKISCLGYGPFASLSECFLVCEDESCSNGIHACDALKTDCDAIVRSSDGLQLPLKGQLVELISYFSHPETEEDYEEEVLQHKRSCMEYGKQLLNRTGAEMSDTVNREAILRFVSGKGTIMFLHFRKAGGSTMCHIMKRANLTVPTTPKGDKRFRSIPFMGRNCNPSYPDASATWFGSAKSQIDWAHSHRIQYFANEVYLPSDKRIPFGQFVLGTQLRHPSKRIYSLYKERKKYQDCLKDCSLKSLNTNISSIAQTVLKNFKEASVPLSTTSLSAVSAQSSVSTEYTVSHNSTQDSCEKLSTSSFKYWLSTQIRSQDVAYFAGANYMEKRHSPSHFLFHGAHGINFNINDLTYAKHMLSKFTFVSILEGMEWMMPEMLKVLNLTGLGGISGDRKGTHVSCALLEGISHDKALIEVLLAVSNLDFELYAYAMQVACVQYFRAVSGSVA